VLQVASVIGHRFWDHLLAQILEMDDQLLRRHLTALQRNQLIKERFQEFGMGMLYTFNSNLMRDAAYESLLRPQRAAYHLRCAELVEEWLHEQEGQPQNMSQVYGFLAHHYEMAGSPRHQMHYHMLAAESAEKIHANEEALYHLDQAADLCEMLISSADSADERREMVETQFEILSSRRWLRLMLADIRGSQDDAERVLKLTETHRPD
jgi:predicted ATPase